jgi:hypothetical protein
MMRRTTGFHDHVRRRFGSQESVKLLTRESSPRDGSRTLSHGGVERALCEVNGDRFSMHSVSSWFH